jgi:hypothetical protein
MPPNFPFLSNIDNVQRKFNAYSSDISVEGSYALKWRANFAWYRAGYVVDLNFSLSLTPSCGDNRFKDINMPSTIYHIIEDPSTTIVTWAPWNFTKPYCVINDVNYTVSPISMQEL